MKIELTAEELRLVVYALKAHALREAALDLDNPDSGPCWDLSEKLLHRKEGDGLLCITCDDEATEFGPVGPMCNDCARLGQDNDKVDAARRTANAKEYDRLIGVLKGNQP